MRKFIPIIAAAIMLTACGKSEPQKEVRLDERFTVTAEMTEGDFITSAEFKRMQEGWEVTMTSPQTVDGMEFELTDIDCMVRYTELNYPIAAETMLDSSPVLMTARALDSCVRSGNQGEIKGQPYLLTCGDGKPQRLQIGSLTVELSGYRAE